MASQLGSQSQIELVIHTTTKISTNNNTNNNHDQQYLSFIMITERSLNKSLTKFHAGYFRISLSLGGQALLWKTVTCPNATNDIIMTKTLQYSHNFFVVLWSLALVTLVSLSLTYLLKCLFQFKTVKAEFLHHVRVNYLFAPWILWLLLLQSATFWGPKTSVYRVLWWAFSIPVLLLDVKIYGQWFTEGRRRGLSTAANPACQLSVIGNLVVAQAAARAGWREPAVCMFSLGMAHYLVLFVTLYQRLSGGCRLPTMLRPVFFLFFAAPSAASLAWESIAGVFDVGSKMLFFLSIFLFTSLICRPRLFKRSMRRFNVAWWAYSFPLTFLALASIKYAQEVKGGISHVLMLLLLGLSFLVSLALVVFTLVNIKI